MVYIEFFSENAVENICSSLLNPPETLCLLGDEREAERMKIHAERYRKLFASRGTPVTVVTRTAEKGSLFSLVRELTQIADREENGGCVIDLTGGDDLCLTAAGIVYGRLGSNPKQVQLQRVDIDKCEILNCDEDGTVLRPTADPALTVPEFVSLYGGEITHKTAGIADLGGEKKAAVDSLWKVCREDPVRWHKMTGLLGFSAKDESVLNVRITDAQAMTYLAHKGATLQAYRQFLSSLGKSPFVSVSHPAADLSEISFRNAFVRRCLTDPGFVLENKTLSRLADVRNPDGTPFFSDGWQSVTVRLDGSSPARESRDGTKNETDVVLMRKMSPYFVSCKNGDFDSIELNRFYSSVAKFGGPYARKILVYSLPGQQIDPGYRDRASYLGIRLVSADCMDSPSFDQTVRSWRP